MFYSFGNNQYSIEVIPEAKINSLYISTALQDERSETKILII